MIDDFVQKEDCVHEGSGIGKLESEPQRTVNDRSRTGDEDRGWENVQEDRPRSAEPGESGEPFVSPSWETLSRSEGGYDPSFAEGLGRAIVRAANVRLMNSVGHVTVSLGSTTHCTQRQRTISEEHALALLNKPCPDYSVMCHELLKFINSNPHTADLKICLYMATSESGVLLKPFPLSVVEESTEGLLALNLINEEVPSVQLIQIYLKEPSQFRINNTVLSLLHWLCVHEREPKITHLPSECFYSIFQKIDKGMNYQQPTQVFRLMNSRSSAIECKWRALKEGRKSKFAFYGDCLKVMHSVIHLGFCPVLHSSGVCGEGLYFSTDLQHSLDRADEEGWCWGKSELGARLKVLLVVEILDHPDCKFYNEYETLPNEQRALTVGGESQELYSYFVPRAELVRIRYVLVFGQRRPSIDPAVVAIRSRSSIGHLLQEKKKAIIFGSLLFLSVTAHYIFSNKAIRSDAFLPKFPLLTSPVSTL